MQQITTAAPGTAIATDRAPYMIREDTNIRALTTWVVIKV